MPNPAIPIGELADVPAVGSPVQAAYHQEVANRVVQRFTNIAARDGWSAVQEGAVCVTTDDEQMWVYLFGEWVEILTRQPMRSIITTAVAPVVADENYFLTLTADTATTVTLPSYATQPFQNSAEVDFCWGGIGQPTFVAGAGATMFGTPGFKMRARYSVATAKKIGQNAWLLIGDLSA